MVISFETEYDIRNHFKYMPHKFMKKPMVVLCYPMDFEFEVKTANGWVKGKPGDWIMIGPNGDIYPCNGDIFDKTYERVRE